MFGRKTQLDRDLAYVPWQIAMSPATSKGRARR